MIDETRGIHGVRVLVCADTGPQLANEGDANTFLSLAWEQNANLVAIPVLRLADDFFRLRTGLAGQVIQKFVNYRLRLAVVGDIDRWAAQSAPLRDFVSEANRGRDLWFVASIAELETRLLSQRS
ncbi:protein of unknown function [Rhizobiales bacterium GAS188]|nr:protein of unknown function [Rhizobiales bacterium GAS188]